MASDIEMDPIPFPSAAIFLDKDGTLVENLPYNVDPARMKLARGAGDALRQFQAAGYLLFVISNQSGVARGLFPEEALKGVRERLEQMLLSEGVKLDGFYYCPHFPEGKVGKYAVTCFCRKPSPGMLFQAVREHGLNRTASWMIGDILTDVECGRRAGCKTILLDNGNETEWLSGPFRRPDYTARDLAETAKIILGKAPFMPEIGGLQAELTSESDQTK